MAGTFYDALNAANVNALKGLSTLQAQNDWNPVPSFMNTINARLRLANAINAGREREDYYNQLKSKIKPDTNNEQGGQQPWVVADKNGYYGASPVTNNGNQINAFAPQENSISVGAFDQPQQNNLNSVFSKAFGGNFSEPTVDNQYAQVAVGNNNIPAQQMSPQDFNEKMRIREWLEYDAKNNGVTNPLVSMDRYRMFMEPMRQQAELDELRNAYYTFNDPEASDVDKRNAANIIEFSKQNPFMMEKFGWDEKNFNNQQQLFEHQKAMWPLDIESKQLGLENTRSLINARNAKERQAVRVGDILKGFTGQFYPINRPGNYEDSDLSKTRKDLVDAADILNTYARNKFGKDLKVTGGWRSEAHNAQVNGSGGSHHLTGHAMDIDASSLSEAELADIQAFAKSIGLNADGDDMYHDKGTGYHMHITLPEGYYLKPVDLGNGKFLTPEMMRGQNGKDNDPFNATHYNVALYEWGGGKDGTSKPNAELAKVIATKFVSDYKQAYKKNGGNRERAIQDVVDIISKDKRISDPVGGDTQLLQTIANEAALYAHGQTSISQQSDSKPTTTGNPTQNSNVGGNGYVPERPPYADEDGVENDGYDQRRRAQLIKNAEEEGLEFNPWTNELQAKGSSTMWDRLFKSRNEIEPQNEKIRRFKERNLLK